jgi:hypothetical protein
MEMNQFNYTIQNRENLINKEDEKKDENDSGRKNKENEIKGKEDLFEGHLNNFENIQKNNSQDEIVRNKLNINDNIKDN